MKKSVRILAVLLVLILTLGTFAACTLKPMSKQLIGKWVDSSELKSGYEFMEDGKVKITYANFNIPIINQNFNGTVDGIYTTSQQDDKNLITLSYTVLLQSINKTYEYNIKDGVLTLTDTENGKQVVFTRGEVASSVSTAS